MFNIFKWIIIKISDLIAANMKLFIAKEINGKIDKVYKKIEQVETKIDQVETKTDYLNGKVKVIEKIVIKTYKEKNHVNKK